MVRIMKQMVKGVGKMTICVSINKSDRKNGQFRHKRRGNRTEVSMNDTYGTTELGDLRV